MKQAGWLLVLVACANNVSQDRATGPDGKLKGAKAIALANGEAKVHGIVTYPGGDRVDWKALEVPAGKRGTLDFQLSWQAPRPGGQLAFDVFDQWNTPIVATKTAGKRGRVRTASVDNASGKYFVRIYAPRRSDAGAYRLVVNFKADDMTKPPLDPGAVPEPPRLPAIPEAEVPCDMFDRNNPDCKTKCAPGSPPDWPKCVEAEKKKVEQEAKELEIKNRPPPPKPADARVLHYENASDGGVSVTLGVGTSSVPALDKTWRAVVVSKATGKPLANGVLVITSVGKTQTFAKSTLTTDQLAANPQVRLTPPTSP
jgi:hypothetical protein